jgi:hypothetical protein
MLKMRQVVDLVTDALAHAREESTGRLLLVLTVG